jgi:hypothetical protein
VGVGIFQRFIVLEWWSVWRARVPSVVLVAVIPERGCFRMTTHGMLSCPLRLQFFVRVCFAATTVGMFGGRMYKRRSLARCVRTRPRTATQSGFSAVLSRVRCVMLRLSVASAAAIVLHHMHGVRSAVVPCTAGRRRACSRRLLHQGLSGGVVVAKHRTIGRLVAIKTIDLAGMSDAEKADLDAEIETLTLVRARARVCGHVAQGFGQCVPVVLVRCSWTILVFCAY